MRWNLLLLSAPLPPPPPPPPLLWLLPAPPRSVLTAPAAPATTDKVQSSRSTRIPRLRFKPFMMLSSTVLKVFSLSARRVKRSSFTLWPQFTLWKHLCAGWNTSHARVSAPTSQSMRSDSAPTPFSCFWLMDHTFFSNVETESNTCSLPQSLNENIHEMSWSIPGMYLLLFSSSIFGYWVLILFSAVKFVSLMKIFQDRSIGLTLMIF